MKKESVIVFLVLLFLLAIFYGIGSLYSVETPTAEVPVQKVSGQNLE